MRKRDTSFYKLKTEVCCAMSKHSMGFSLVEMAVVLVIAGLLISTVISVGNAQIGSSRISSTKAKEEAVKTALISYISRNKRLPCPAIPTLAPGAAGYGLEAALPGTCTAVPTAAGVATGVIPWISLGMTDDAALDGYYNRFTYAVTLTSTNLTPATVAGMEGNITIHTGTPIAAGNQSNNCTPTGWTYNPCSVVSVVLSYGSNGNGAYTPAGTRIPMPLGADELENTNTGQTFVDKDFASGGANVFDDILLSMNANDLLTPLTVNGSIKDTNSALQHNFDLMTGAAVSLAAINRTGAAPNRTYVLPQTAVALTLPLTAITDPWGNSIAYTAILSVDQLTPESNAIVMTSLGPNGIAGGGDDISSVVLVSELKSKFTAYGW